MLGEGQEPNRRGKVKEGLWDEECKDCKRRVSGRCLEGRGRRKKGEQV